MLIYEALQKDHLKIKRLIDELVGAGHSGEQRRAKLLIEEVRDELIPHSRAEESVFYHILGEFNPAQPLVLHCGFQEHIEAETLLHALHDKSNIDAEWILLAEKLKRAIENHIAEEENEIFAVAKEILTEKDAEMMTQAFEKLKPLVPKEGFVKSTIDLVVHLMPPKYVATLRSLALAPDHRPVNDKISRPQSH